MMSDEFIFGIGFAAQLFFSARMIVQWVKSEIAYKVLSPVIFWYLSLAGALLLMVYGACREDIVIIFGQVLMYYIYIRNLALKKTWQQLPIPARVCLFLLPFLVLCWLVLKSGIPVARVLQHEHIPELLLIWGGFGQGIFLFRFVSQWLSSEKIKASIFPLNFWIFSLAGSFMLLIYAALRHDPVIFLGHIFGTVAYVRNIIIHHRQMDVVVR
jgi:lipid-A-disaccharide synthase-like uncharacterized protein